MFDELIDEEKRIVGTKQLLKALRKDEVAMVFVAEDAEEHVKERIVKAIGEKDVHLVYADSMAQIGEACGIDVGSACAAILR